MTKCAILFLVLSLIAQGTFGQQNGPNENVAAQQPSGAAEDVQQPPPPVATPVVEQHPDDVGAVPAAAEPVGDVEEKPMQPSDNDGKTVVEGDVVVVQTTEPPPETSTDGGHGEEGKKEDKKGAWSWWTKVTCIILGPLGYGCPDKKKAEEGGQQQAQRKGVHGMIAVIQESGEAAQFDQQLESLEKEVNDAAGGQKAETVGEDAEPDQEQQQQQEEEEVEGEVQVTTVEVESSTEQGGKGRRK